MKRTIHTTFFLFYFSGIQLFAQVANSAKEIKPLFVGDTIPNIELTKTDGSKAKSKDLFNKRSVLIVYRGGWCPYCTRHLSAVGMSLDSIHKLGYEVMAISPDSPEKLSNTIEKDSLLYTLLSDQTGEFTKQMGLAFKAPERYGDFLKKASGGTNEGWLPVPSIFVLDDKGVILFEYIVPDYKIRMTSELLLHVLVGLREK